MEEDQKRERERDVRCGGRGVVCIKQSGDDVTSVSVAWVESRVLNGLIVVIETPMRSCFMTG